MHFHIQCKFTTTPFQRAHALQYAVRVTQRSASDESNTSVVIESECLFSVCTYGESARSGSSTRRPFISNTSKSRSKLTTIRNTIRRSIQKTGNNIIFLWCQTSKAIFIRPFLCSAGMPAVSHEYWYHKYNY